MKNFGRAATDEPRTEIDSFLCVAKPFRVVVLFSAAIIFFGESVREPLNMLLVLG